MSDMKRFAPLIAELLVNAGWIDDGDELIRDIWAIEGRDVAMEKAKEVEALVAIVNAELPEDQRFVDIDIQQYLEE